jgi:hypothetical protein
VGFGRLTPFLIVRFGRSGQSATVQEQIVIVFSEPIVTESAQSERLLRHHPQNRCGGDIPENTFSNERLNSLRGRGDQVRSRRRCESDANQMPHFQILGDPVSA